MNHTKTYYSPKQGRLPLFITDFLDICDPVLAFDKIMEEIGIEKYRKPQPAFKPGRSGYNQIRESVQDIFKAIMCYIEQTDGMDLQYLYIDGSKFEANANKYT